MHLGITFPMTFDFLRIRSPILLNIPSLIKASGAAVTA